MTFSCTELALGRMGSFLPLDKHRNLKQMLAKHQTNIYLKKLNIGYTHMPHNLANIQPPLTVSSLSLVRSEGKGKTRSLVTPQQDCNWLLQHRHPMAECGNAESSWPVSHRPCCSATWGKRSPSLSCCVYTPGALIHLSFSLNQHCGMWRGISCHREEGAAVWKA